MDAPHTPHRVMERGIEQTALFRDDMDRADFVARLGALSEQGALTVYACKCISNHAHRLVRMGVARLRGPCGAS